jgi:hypothetical protein
VGDDRLEPPSLIRREVETLEPRGLSPPAHARIAQSRQSVRATSVRKDAANTTPGRRLP